MTVVNSHVAEELSRKQRVGQAALKAFFKITGAWGIEDADRCLMLDELEVSQGLSDDECAPQALQGKSLVKIKLLIQIHRILVDQFQTPGDRLVFLYTPTASFPFLGATPVRLLVNGDRNDLAEIIEYLPRCDSHKFG